MNRQGKGIWKPIKGYYGRYGLLTDAIKARDQKIKEMNLDFVEGKTVL